MNSSDSQNTQTLHDIFSSNPSSNQWLVKILASINNGILITDESSIVLYVNPEYSRITGIVNEQIIGRHISAVRPGAILPNVIKTGISQLGVFRRVGDIEYVVDMAPIFIDGQIVGGVSIVKDISEVKRLSDELQQFENKAKRLKSVVDSIYRAKYTFKNIIGESIRISETLKVAERASRNQSDILICGESGTGKEVFAQAIHNDSRRANGPFVPLNCASISPTLVESELFGFDDGAFTGAKKGGKIGLFEIADGGTIFFDEIAELSLDMQAKLLRVLQERSIRRVGETSEIALDLRVISATNKDLRNMVQSGKFREDLYYRLNVMEILLPPLRDRGGDVRLLAEKIFQKFSMRFGHNIVVDDEVTSIFSRYAWPGNVRELQNVIEYSVNSCEDGHVKVQHLPQWLPVADLVDTNEQISLEEIVQRFEQKTINALLEKYGNSVDSKRRIAQRLGISIATLYNKLKKNSSV